MFTFGITDHLQVLSDFKEIASAMQPVKAPCMQRFANSLLSTILQWSTQVTEIHGPVGLLPGMLGLYYPALPCITLYYPVTLHYLRGMLALHYPGGKRRLASLLPGCSVTHRLSFRRMQAKAAPVNLRRGRHIGGRGVTGVGKGWRLYMASLPACTSHGNT